MVSEIDELHAVEKLENQEDASKLQGVVGRQEEKQRRLRDAHFNPDTSKLREEPLSASEPAAHVCRPQEGGLLQRTICFTYD